MLNRRKFIQRSAAAGLVVSAPGFPLDVFANGTEEKLTILHTNDWHSRIDPFPDDGSKYAGLGGAAQRSAVIKKIRSEEKNVLLLDAGDIFQGTPYFNFYHGEPELTLMSEMGYDASAIGNHDFDAGVDGLAKQLAHASFPLICANYDFTGTSMEKKTVPYQIFKRGKIKIGVLGLGIELNGLVPNAMYGKTVYQEPVAVANKIADALKHDYHCDIIICLSHLGFEYSTAKVSDKVLAKNTRNIDLILGGHTHTFLDSPVKEFNLDGKEVVINQVGWAGLLLGRIDFLFQQNKKKIMAQTQIVKIGNNPN